MAKLIALKIIDGTLSYTEAITTYARWRPGIDSHLAEVGRADLIAT